MVYKDLAATIGETPIVELARLANGLPGRVVAKLEMRNPCGSIKDRLGVALIEDAERRGALEPGMTIVEATGGNTATFRTFRHFPGTHFPGTPYAIRTTFRGHHTQFGLSGDTIRNSKTSNHGRSSRRDLGRVGPLVSHR